MNSRQVCNVICEHFESLGFKSIPARNLANSGGKTDLVIAGVQIFDDATNYCNHQIREGKIFIAQPCVRMQFQGVVEFQEGISTSFINICTEMVNKDFKEHLQTVDQWYSVFSKLGLHMNDFVIIEKEDIKNWGTGDFSTKQLFFVYKGLELGDASYFLFPRKDETLIPTSDIGFGLERIVWSINKTDSYFDIITPWTVNTGKEMLDSCRTLSLLALCGIKASNNGPGLQFRRFSRVLSEKYYNQEIYYLLLHYFDYWSQFIKPIVSREDAVRSACLEIDRFINLKVSKALGVPFPCMETTEDYFNRLVYNHDNINIRDLRETIKKCQKK
jgi:hypothetical protein